MATLENIRKRGVFLTIVIGGSLLAFVLSGVDFSSLFGDNPTEVASVNGNSIGIEEYNARIDEMTTFYKIEMGQSSLDEGTTRQIQDAVWNTWLREQLISQECEELKISISDEEFSEMILGSQPHPMLLSLRAFYNPTTNSFDKSLVIDLLNAIEQEPNGEIAQYWSFIKRNIKLQLLEEKYTTLIASSFNYNKLDAAAAFESKKKANITFVTQPYYTLADSNFSVSEEEIKEYYKNNSNKYQNQEESRKINYVTYSIQPSADDFNNIKTWIESLKNEFSTSDDFVSIANRNSDVTYNDIALSKNKIDPNLRDFAFSAKVGDIYGPVLNGDTYMMARLVETGISAPDSIKVRHILVPSQKQADSIVAVLKSGVDFATLASKHSLARTSQVGGEIGWMSEGDFDLEFSRACFKGKVNKVFTFPFQGMVQVVEITEATKAVNKVKICVLSRKVEASSQTYANIYNNASQYIAKNSTASAFKDSAKVENGIFLRNAVVSSSDYVIADLKDSRKIVNWAYQAKVGEVSEKVFECGDRFVVASLEEVNPKGTKSLESVKDEIKLAIINANKAEKMIADMKAKLADSNDISILGEVKTAEEVSMASAFIAGIGREPKVAGAIPSLISDNDIKFVAGESGVYAIKLVEALPVGLMDEKFEIENLTSRTPYQMMIFEGLKNQAEIKDNRVKFF